MILKALRSLIFLKGFDKGRRIVGLIAVAASFAVFYLKGVEISPEEVSKHIDVIVTGIYGLASLFVGVLDAERPSPE